MAPILDKVILLFACLASLMVVPFSTLFIVALLAAIVAAFLGEIKTFPPLLSTIGIALYFVAALFFPSFVLLVPLVAYDYVSKESWFFRLIGLVPLLVGLRFFDLPIQCFLIGLALVSFFLAQRTQALERELATHKQLRDTLREESYALELKNRDLRERQDLEIHLATLAERSRIAREIHDNVGHLLTRSVLQVEALQVIHANDEQVRDELAQVGSTVHEALDTVRMSVHDLHDDGFDLEFQLRKIAEDTNKLTVDITYRASDLPRAVGYCFLALSREALANTLKHSDATVLNVSVIEQPRFYRLSLEDNGSQSVPLQKPRPGKTKEDTPLLAEGIGLKNMEERVRALDGIFRINQDKGFSITASIPKEEAPL